VLCSRALAAASACKGSCAAACTAVSAFPLWLLFGGVVAPVAPVSPQLQ
jgi:hypothetical protein